MIRQVLQVHFGKVRGRQDTDCTRPGCRQGLLHKVRPNWLACDRCGYMRPIITFKWLDGQAWRDWLC